MIRLGELVGAILNEMAIARTQATLFGAQMAADFRDHELLRELPIHIYGIGGAEINVPFAVANVPAGGDETGRLSLEPSQIVEAARRVTDALTEQQTLEEAFSVYDNQVEHWRREVAPAIAERFASDAAEALSLEGASAICGYLTKTHYLLDLIQRRREVARARLQDIIDARHPDAVEDAARRLLTQELEAILSPGAEEDQDALPEEEKERRLPYGPRGTESAIYVHVEAKELEEADRISTLKLELEEGILEQMTFSKGEEVGRE